MTGHKSHSTSSRSSNSSASIPNSYNRYSLLSEMPEPSETLSESHSNAISEIAEDEHSDISDSEAHWDPSFQSDSQSSSIKSKTDYSTSDHTSQRSISSNSGNKIDLGVARVLATFYPKFENTNAEREVRSQLLKMVEAERGVLEVSVKHSGSLFMWAGAQRGAFAKNSFGNEYTAVGVWVLSETLKRAWGANQAPSIQSNLNEYVQKHNLSISMELVTAVLGDHGQRPLQDYVVVTAICDLSHKPKFYSTHDIIRFCRIWRLPTNQYWLFHTKGKVQQYLSAYEALNEEGTARTVEETLNAIADISIPGTAVHTLVQGEIMEGLVSRLVSNSSVSKMHHILQHYPPHTPDEAAGSGHRLRDIFSSPIDLNQKISLLLDEAGPHLCTKSDWFSTASGESEGYGKHENIPSNSLLGKFLHSTPADSTSAQIQHLIQTVKKRKMPIQFKCKPRPVVHSANQIKELFARNQAITHDKISLDDLPTTVKDHFVITVHAYSDSAFRIYRSMMKDNPKLWPLFRGFFIEANVLSIDSSLKGYFDHAQDLDDESKEYLERVPTTPMASNDDSSHLFSEIEETPLVDDMKHLMLKMKLLPYKIRTFLIRNGLSSLLKGGNEKYKEHYLRLIKSWDTSPSKSQQLSYLCDSWAQHVSKIGKDKIKPENYLDIAEPFLKNFAKTSLKNARLVGDFELINSFSKLTIETEEEEADDEASYATPKLVVPRKFQGLLIFFPGIPGCAKSALCQHLLSENDLGDGRKLDSLVGDLTQGKYWKILADRRAKNKAVNTLADKNAPNEEVWKTIEVMCKKTEALGVPVIPESPGTLSNPYDEEVLSVFIYRVLQRENHPGNLDKSSPTPGYVVLMFYNLYEGKDREFFENTLKGRFGLVVNMPVLRKDRPPFPDEIHDIIQKGQTLFNRFKSKYGRVEPVKTDMKNEFLSWESELKTVFAKYSQYLESIQVSFDQSASVVKKQLSDIACGRIIASPPQSDSDFSLAKSAKFAALKIQREAVLNAMKKLAEKAEDANEFWKDKRDELEKKDKFHVTLAHRSQGLSKVTQFAKFQGANIQLQISHFLLGKNTAALFVDWGDEDKEKGIVCSNEFPHITVWTGKGIPPKQANELPKEVKSGSAKKLEFSEPVVIHGIVEFM